MKASSEDQTPSISLYLVQALKEGSVIVAGLFCLYLFFALVFFDAQDPSWLVSDNHREVNNATGLAGAYLSGLVLALFGYWAYLFPLLAGWQLFILLHRHRNQPWHWPLFVYRLFGFVILLASGAGLAFLHFSSLQTELQQGSGGILGQRIGFLLLPLFDLLGSTLIMLAALLLGLRMFIDMSWQSVFERVGGWLTDTWDYLIDRWHQRQQSQIALQEVEAHVESRKVALEEHVKVQQERTPVKIQAPKPVAKPSARLEREKQGSLFTQGDTVLPGIALLDVAEKDPNKSYSTEVLEAMSKRLELKLKDYGIDAQVVAVLPGPVITSFEVKPAAGVKVSKITNLAKDLARSLAVVSVRVVEVIPGKSVIGIEIPNEYREMVRFSEVVASDEFDKAASPITLALGHDISGQPVAVDLAKMPHLLVAGTTGSGKSVGINAMLLSILFKSTPEQVRMILVDPKMLELSVYEGIPHLLTPVVTDMKDAANALKWCVAEMERRYRLMTAMGVRNLAGFNRKIKQAAERDETIPDPTWQPNDSLDAQAPALEHLPLIVVVIDEFADMMMIIGKKIKVDELIARIAQKARAAGIHLILATQRPSVDVITGLIKANVPTRIGFQVSSRIDSRTILDQGGAEQLLGHGDMLYLPPGAGVPVRVHGAFVDDDEVHRVVKDWAERAQPEYIDEVIEPPVEGSIGAGSAFSLEEDGDNPEADEFYDLAVEFVTQTRRASISAVQRKFRIGYNRAARLVETMEAAGVVSTAGHNGGREVLAPAPRAD